MRKFRLSICGIATALSFVALAMASSVHATEGLPGPRQAQPGGTNWSKTYKFSGRPNLRVTTNDGHVDLYASTDGQIDAHVTTRGWTIGDRGVKITESQSGNDINIDVHVPTMHFFFGWNDRSVRIELRVPHEADFDVETGDGSVTSQPFHGQLRISTGDGNIDANGLKGELRLHSGDGRITASDLDGSLRADSGDGHIEVHGRFDVLNLESGDGAVVVEAASGSKISSDWSLRSGDGSITLRLPDGLNADLDAHTGDGHISLDFPVTVQGSISGSTIRGKIGAGGPPLMIRTGDGSIHIEKI